MSGYVKMSADEWEPEHYRGAWSPENRAPRWWAFMDCSWSVDRLKVPSVSEMAAAWGWSKSSAYDLLQEVLAFNIATGDCSPEDVARLTHLRRRPRDYAIVNGSDDDSLFEMPGPLTHADVVARAVRWLRGHHKCSVTFAEFSTSAPLIPDAIGWRLSWSVLVEAKVSRSDFRADADKLIHSVPDSYPGQERWYLTSPNLVRPEEIPGEWGLAEVGARSVRIVKPAARDWGMHIHHIASRSYAETPYLLSAIRRHELGVKWLPDVARFESVSAAKARGSE